MRISKFVPLLFLFLWHPLVASGENNSPSSAPIHVQTTTVREQQINSRIEVVGTLQAIHQAVIAAKITGTILDIPVVLGERVEKGALLVKINAEEISARLLQAQAQLAQARRNLQREEKLLKQQASTPETVKTMKDTLAVAQAGYHEAASMLSYTTINAPFSGVITQKIVNNGDLATPGAALLHLENPKQLQVIAPVPESLILQIHQGDTLTLHIPAVTQELSGTIGEISPIVDSHSRTSLVKINFAPAPGLRTGMFARVQLPGKVTTTLMVPETAIVPFGQMEKIFVVQKNRAQLRLVRSGRHRNGEVEILSGLKAGEEIVSANNTLLSNGQTLITSK